MRDLSEKETRNKIIDPILARTGWKKEYIKEEVNSVKSNFKTKEYKLFDGHVEKGVDKFIDYLLLDEDYSPLAIIEAKRSSLSFEKGEIQAKTYQEDIKKQTGKIIPYFLTNGKEWKYSDQNFRERKIFLPFEQKDLHRRIHLFENEKDPTKIRINSKIVDRARSQEAVKVILEHFERGKRAALINMATGTGKTRVAMAIIDNLIRSNYVRNVLFVVDRISLSNQAKENGFKEFFSGEPVCELNVEGFSGTSRLYVSTVQTLMSDKKPRGKFYEKFGAGAFDLIVYDEAHRSYYDKNNDVLNYFDALKLGLTATPRKDKSKGQDTFDLFGCNENEPTYKYDYDSAVSDEVLVPYITEVIETKILSLGIEGKKLSKELRFELEKQEESPDEFQTPGARFEKLFTDTRTNELIIQEFMDRCYTTDDGVPCKTIFFCASVKHAEALKNIFDRFYPNLTKEVRVITSDRTRYMDEVRRFKKNSTPRIALSVGVLDTGIDIPEIMNLVFVKPVFSYMRFWQMLGRGTRNLEVCKHKDWLPHKNGIAVKDNFLILDFKFGEHSNVEFHGLDRTRQKSKLIDAKTRIFLEQVDLLEKNLEGKEKRIIENSLIETIEGIDVESPLVLEKKNMIKKVISRKFDLKEHIKELREEISPLLIYSKSENSKVYTFVSNCIKLFEAIKEGDNEKIGEIEEFVKERVENVWEKGLEVIEEKNEEIKEVLGDEFWQEATLTGEEYISPFKNHEDCRWSKWSEYDANKILIHVRDVVFPFMRNLGTGGSFAKYMERANFEIPTASLLIEAVKIINDMHIKEQNQDAQGDMYEYLLSELQTAGKNGQFRTPRHIIKMMVELTKPKFNDLILDPACGTAGFLINAYEHILKQNTSKDLIKTDEDGNEYNFKADKLSAKQKQILDEESLYGFDIDPTMTRISLMNLMMHGLTKPNIEQLNTLSKRYNQDNTYDLILANPPFKGSIDESESSDNLTIKSKKTELLFLELMYNCLTNGGRCAVIVPDGVLFGNSKAHKDIRKKLLEDCRLDAIIKMPSGVFKPYAGVSTAVLFFTKGEPTKNVWFYDMQSDGFSLDDKRTQIGDGKGDIPEIIEEFEKRKEESNEDRTKKHFFVPVEEIIKNDYDLSISKYKKIIYEEEKFEHPSKYLERIEKTGKEILEDISELKRLIQ